MSIEENTVKSKSLISIKDFKSYAKRIFKDVDLLPKGFGLDCITIIFHKTTMEILDFDERTGKLKKGHFLYPSNYTELLKRLRFHCGEEKIISRLKPNITIQP